MRRAAQQQAGRGADGGPTNHRRRRCRRQPPKCTDRQIDPAVPCERLGTADARDVSLIALWALTARYLSNQAAAVCACGASLTAPRPLQRAPNLPGPAERKCWSAFVSGLMRPEPSTGSPLARWEEVWAHPWWQVNMQLALLHVAWYGPPLSQHAAAGGAAGPMAAARALHGALGGPVDRFCLE